MNWQVQIHRRDTGGVVWSDGGFASDTDARHAADIQLIGRDDADFYITTEVLR